MGHHDDLDRILSAETEILPASGFTAAVMEAVRAETSAPPLAFPWTRALPGIAAAILLVLAPIVDVLVHGWREAFASWRLNDWSWLDPLLTEVNRPEIRWIALAIAVSVVSMTWATRVVGARRI